MWEIYDLPSFVLIEGKKFEIKTDWRNIIDIFECFNDSELTMMEKTDCLLDLFYKNYEEIPNVEEALRYLILFINGNKKISEEETSSNAETPLILYDWQKDLPLIIPPINKILGFDIREKKHLHWFTFLGAFYEIGECAFKTYVDIRYKLAKRKKLEDYEKEIYRNHKSEIEIKQNIPQYDNFDEEDILMKFAKQKKGVWME